METKSNTEDDRCTPRGGLVGYRIYHTLQSTAPEFGELRQPLKCVPMAEKWLLTATQWAFHSVPKDWSHGRIRQLSGYHWNLVASVLGKTLLLVRADDLLGSQEIA